MWICCGETGFIEFGYNYRGGVFDEGRGMLFDDDGFQCYAVHSNGRDFSETGVPGTYNIPPYEIAAAIKEHEAYEGGPVRLISCYAGVYPGGAAEEVAYYLGQPVRAALQSVYVDEEDGMFYSLEGGLLEDTLKEMKQQGHRTMTPEYQETQWVDFYV